ncbi:ATP-binding protein [Candidatus Omnitrophota bacterium]
MWQWNALGIINILTSILCGALITLLLTKNRKDYRTLSFCAFLFAIILHTFSFALSRFITERELAILFFKICIVAAVIIVSTLIHFVHVVLNIHKEKKKYLIITHILNATFAYASTGLLYNGFAEKFGWGLWPNASPLVAAYLCWWILQVIYCLYILYDKGVKKTTGKDRIAHKQVLGALIVGFAGGSTTWFLWYDIPCPPYFNAGIGLFALWIGYAVFRHHLFDIEIIIKKTAIFTGLCFSAGCIVFLSSILTSPLFETLGIPSLVTTLLSFAIFIAIFRPLEIFLENATNKWLFQKRINYEQLLTSLGETLRKISELDPLCSILSQTMMEILNITYFVLYVYSPDDDEYILKIDENSKLHLPGRFDPKDNFISFIEKNDSIQAYDFTTNVFMKNQLQQLEAKVVIPLRSAQRLIGFALLGTKLSEHDYNPQDINAFTTLQTSVAKAIENALAIEKLKQSQINLAHKEKFATIGILAAGIKHEINNPLFVILGRTEMLLRQSTLSKNTQWSREELIAYVEKQLNSIKFNADRIADIVERLSNFSRPLDQADMQKLNIKNVIKDSIKLLGYDDKHMENITIDIKLNPKLEVLGDHRMLMQVFFNLLNNAIHAMNFKGCITIDCTVNHRTYITVRDTGGGVERKHLKRIFDPFFTTKDTTQGDHTAIKGTGLGLHLVYNYAKKMNGDIQVESEPNKGTTFTLILDSPQ